MDLDPKHRRGVSEICLFSANPQIFWRFAGGQLQAAACGSAGGSTLLASAEGAQGVGTTL